MARASRISAHGTLFVTIVVTVVGARTDDGDRSKRFTRVFVSYAHDSVEHRAQVRELWLLLRNNGVDAHMDDMYDTERRDWFAWVIDQIDRADYVLVIASPRYRAAGDGQGEPNVSRGVQTESALLRDRLHRDREVWLPKLLPVVLPGHEVAEIPEFLQPYCASHYLVRDFSVPGAEELVRTVLGSVRADPLAAGTVTPPTTGTPEPDDRPPATEQGMPPAHVRMRATTRDKSQVYQAGRDLHIGER
jgi:hypothetical protein